jgi:hypothetical protein
LAAPNPWRPFLVEVKFGDGSGAVQFEEELGGDDHRASIAFAGRREENRYEGVVEWAVSGCQRDLAFSRKGMLKGCGAGEFLESAASPDSATPG